jgi:hypothetical protein
MNNPQQQTNKIVLKVYNKNTGEERRPHNCALCQVYKREIAKGNTDALTFYRDHINEFIKKYNGATLVFKVKATRKALPVTTKKAAK